MPPDSKISRSRARNTLFLSLAVSPELAQVATNRAASYALHFFIPRTFAQPSSSAPRAALTHTTNSPMMANVFGQGNKRESIIYGGAKVGSNNTGELQALIELFDYLLRVKPSLPVKIFY